MRIGSKGAAVAICAVVLGGAGTALATDGLGIVGADGVIHGCYQTEQGLLRVVAADAVCRDSEAAIDWSEQGPKGEQGPVGPQGPIGPQGEPGAKGETGATGAMGETGATGATGPAGEKGDKGDPGVAGSQGLRGETGATGEQGPEGPPGPKGDDGTPGLSGYQIVIADTEVSSERMRVLTAECPAGKQAIGGGAGAILHPPAGATYLTGYITTHVDNPSPDGRSWTAVASEIGDGTPMLWRLRVRVLCAFVD